jgi:hypothetical protein
VKEINNFCMEQCTSKLGNLYKRSRRHPIVNTLQQNVQTQVQEVTIQLENQSNNIIEDDVMDLLPNTSIDTSDQQTMFQQQFGDINDLFKPIHTHSTTSLLEFILCTSGYINRFGNESVKSLKLLLKLFQLCLPTPNIVPKTVSEFNKVLDIILYLPIPVSI